LNVYIGQIIEFHENDLGRYDLHKLLPLVNPLNLLPKKQNNNS